MDPKVVDAVSGRRWDLSSTANQREVEKMLNRDRPTLLAIAPPSTFFAVFESEAVRADHLKFATRLAKLQMAGDKYFLFTQPTGATALWQPSVLVAAAREGIGMTTVDMCAYGQFDRDAGGQGIARLMTNCPAMIDGFGRRCCGHRGRKTRA